MCLLPLSTSHLYLYVICYCFFFPLLPVLDLPGFWPDACSSPALPALLLWICFCLFVWTAFLVLTHACFMDLL